MYNLFEVLRRKIFSPKNECIMKTFSCILTLFIIFASSFSGEAEIVHEKMIYKKINERELSVDVFYEKDMAEPTGKPAIAFIHGGGWVFGSPEEFYNACERYAQKGFVTFSFQYRLSINDDGSYPNPEICLIESVKDARSAVRWMKANAESLGIDPDRIVVSGQSAGGQLALSTVLMNDINENSDDPELSPVPSALLLFSSCVNTMEAWIDMIMGERRELIWAVSPYHNLKPGLPPTLAFHGEADCMVLYYTMQFFHERMMELGNPFELVTLEGRDHYLGGDRNGKYAGYVDEAILERADEFLRELGYMK